MSQQVVLTIFAFLLGTTIINFLIAVAARVYTGYRPYGDLILYWTSLMVTYAAAAVLNNGPVQIGFAFFPQFIPMYYLTKFLYDAREMRFPFRPWLAGVVVSSVASGWMLLTHKDFTLAMLPVVVAGCWIMVPPAWNTLVAARRDSSWIEKGIACIFIGGIIHHFNYAFFRLDASTQYWGWSISIAEYQSLSIFLPLLLLQRRERRERSQLSTVIERISGAKPEFAPRMEVERLYTELELALVQKETVLEHLRAANLELDEKRSMNEILVKTMAHDLCNPLTVLTSYISLLQDAERGGGLDVPAVLKKMERSAKVATDIIWRIRQAMRAPLRTEPLDRGGLERVARETEEALRPLLERKDLRLEFENLVPAGVFARVDAGALGEHILANALSNAIKFSPRGGRILVRLELAGEALRIQIMDQGIGLARNDEESPAHRPGTEGETGTGFGVLLMRFFASRMGGRVHLQSPSPIGRPGQPGTLVAVELLETTQGLAPSQPARGPSFKSDAPLYS